MTRDSDSQANSNRSVKTRSKAKTTHSDTEEEQSRSGSRNRSGRRGTQRRAADATTADETETESEDETECPECNGDIEPHEQRGEKVCTDCGLVIDESEIDHGPEWRAFDSKERSEKSRVGSPVNKMMHDDGLSTTIDWRDKDAYGNQLRSKQKQKMHRLRKWDERSKTQDSKDRNLRHALGEISRMASALGLPRDVQKIASMIYRRCLENDMLPGRSIEGMSSAALYAAARMEDIPRSLKEIERVSRVDEKEIGRAYRYTDRELGLGIGPSDPIQYIPRFIGEIDELGQETERLARRLVEHIKDAELHSGKTPPGIAAAAIYMAAKLCGNTPTQSKLAEVTGVTEVTIRERYQDIMNHGEEAWLHTEV